jgi:hypothetical protein
VSHQILEGENEVPNDIHYSKSLIIQVLNALRDVEQAWVGNGDMATAVDAVLLAIDAARRSGYKDFF